MDHLYHVYNGKPSSSNIEAMKKKIVIILIIFVVGFASFLVTKIVLKNNQNSLIALQKQNLPDFAFYNQDLQVFSSGQLKPQVSVCIFYYNAECEHCQYEAAQISKNIDAFKNTQVIMISTNLPGETAVFQGKYNLKNTGFLWLYDKDYAFYKWFGQSIAPSVYIYNEDHKLVKEYRGEIKIEAVLKHLNHGEKG